MAKMCIGVLSDTHGNRRAFDRALEAMGAVDLLLHAGDFANDAIVMGNMYGIPVQTVAGNCDFFGTAEEAKLFEIAGHTILLVHGHRQHVKSGLEELYEAGCANGADICIFGHTHCHEIEWRGNMVLINPGSPSQPRGSKPSCIRMMLEDGIPPDIQLLML